MATVDSDKVVCGGIHAMIVAVLVIKAAHLQIHVNFHENFGNIF
jgi:hypothetical protein